MVALGAMNYPEEIPNLYTRLLASYIPKEEQFSETRKIREAFTKLCGIQGAAKVECHDFSFFTTIFTTETELTKEKDWLSAAKPLQCNAEGSPRSD
jgi:hypothetical protein